MTDAAMAANAAYAAYAADRTASQPVIARTADMDLEPSTERLGFSGVPVAAEQT